MGGAEGIVHKDVSVGGQLQAGTKPLAGGSSAGELAVQVGCRIGPPGHSILPQWLQQVLLADAQPARMLQGKARPHQALS